MQIYLLTSLNIHKPYAMTRGKRTLQQQQALVLPSLVQGGLVTV